MRHQGVLALGSWAALTVLSSPSSFSTEPSLYRTCGVTSVGSPTREQLLCIAEGIGVPTDEHQRAVRRGFNELVAEPTLEVFHAVDVKSPNGGEAFMVLKLELSEVDGQVLYYGHSSGLFGPAERALQDDVVNRRFPGSIGFPPVARSCGVSETAPVDRERALCMARALGMPPGTRGLEPHEEREEAYGGPGWRVMSLLDDRMCQSYGTDLELSARDGSIVRYGFLEGHCADGPQPERPILRKLREE